MSRKRKSPPKSPAPQAYAGELRPSAAVSPPYRPLPVRLPPVNPNLCRAVARAQKEVNKYAHALREQKEEIRKRKIRRGHDSARLRIGDRSARRRNALSVRSDGVSYLQQPYVRPRISMRRQMRVARMLSLLQSEDVSSLLSRVCRARSARRRALFGLRRTGQGASRHRGARWSASSYVRCK